MHILLTGGTGLIGRQLCRHWLAQGHRLSVWSRRPEQVAQLCGAQVKGVALLEELGEEPIDAVINLAGAPIADRPWTRKRKANELLEEFGLTDAAKRPLKNFSGGMRRRLDLAASLISQPPLIFLDEPTTGLDPRTRSLRLTIEKFSGPTSSGTCSSITGGGRYSG